MSSLEDRLQKFTAKKACGCKSLRQHKDVLMDQNSNLKDLDLLASGLKILSQESRLRILYLLRDKPMCFCELEFMLQLKQSTVSHHLLKLKELGLISLIKDGRWTMVKLVKTQIIGQLDILLEIMNE